MNPVSRAALHTYVLATARARRRLLQRMCAEGRAPVCILFHHRVADQYLNPWTISNRHFIHRINWIRRHADMVSLQEAQHRLRNGNRRLAVSITFDDGYAENCDQALPLLQRLGVPCTYFVSLDFVLTGRPFPHDQRLGRPLPPNTPGQLRQLAAAGVEIGAHTRHHVNLGAVRDESVLYDEVVRSAQELSAEVDAPVRYFAFPYGLPENLNPRVARMARAAGFQGVLSAFGGYNIPLAVGDAFYLRRIHGDAEFARLQNWVTLDPRKLQAAHADHAMYQSQELAQRQAVPR
jgi:peptidoglycan/xylan/chitin deacetylase (PgdA/CDA1 family)